MATATRRARRRQQREESRRVILAAAEQMLRERPFREISVDELMLETGLTRTVFYRHFADLPDLVLQLLQTVGGQLTEISRQWVSASQSERSGRESLAAVVDFFRQHGPLIRAVADAASYDEEIDRVYSGVVGQFVDLTAGALEELVRAGRIGPIDVPETARALTAMNERYLLQSFGREPGADPARVLEALWTIWRRAIYGGDPRS